MLTYGSESWRLTKRTNSKLEVVEIKLHAETEVIEQSQVEQLTKTTKRTQLI